MMIVVPAFDYRWHWSAVPAWLAFLADAGIVTSFVIFFLVMKQNSYAAATVRVEAGQPVISTGLYGVVRHPMYAGALLMTVCMPLALGSYWSLLLLSRFPSWLGSLTMTFLDAQLAGRAAYCRQVRYRLIPWVWSIIQLARRGASGYVSGRSKNRIAQCQFALAGKSIRCAPAMPCAPPPGLSALCPRSWGTRA